MTSQRSESSVVNKSTSLIKLHVVSSIFRGSVESDNVFRVHVLLLPLNETTPFPLVLGVRAFGPRVGPQQLDEALGCKPS
ncbi:hypothetical protein EYF80_047156 [Liparis tanakae]|uniref:Uncharacterized protein n=1 Tax=Liparis tanakae TaxID=230148 RepID=A0A4Z2FNE7_9TELE|nr:hypothetical protein EYF80_047156 [Liparis tanakae]